MNKITTSESANDFALRLKDIASRKLLLRTSDTLIILKYLNKYIKELDIESLSNCIWAIGTLKLTIDDIKKDNELIIMLNNRVNILSFQANRIELFRLMAGLGKMGFKWVDLPSNLQNSFLDIIINGKGLDSREVSSLFYILGQMKFTASILDTNTIEILLNTFLSVSDTFTPQGFCNALHGLARLDINWDKVTQIQQLDLLKYGFLLLPNMRSDEVCSLLNSFANLNIKWNNLSSDFQCSLQTILADIISNMNNRELANILWSLGKMDLSFSSAPVTLQKVLLDKITRSAPTMKAFDVESIFLGLGLMEVQYDMLPQATQNSLKSSIEDFINNMNIFCVYNVLWGLARMGATKESLGIELSSALFDETIRVLHTFLPQHFGDVAWAIASLGFKKSDVSKTHVDRLLAVFSRVYAKLHVRAAAYTLWGFNKMDITWQDMLVGTKSLAEGREAPPLAESVSKFLRYKVQVMKEHEYSVLLSSLGELGAKWSDFSPLVLEKITHRTTRVGPYFSSRSLSMTLHGLSRMNAKWADLPIPTREAFTKAMINEIDNTSNAENNNNNNKKENYRKGIAGMNSIELNQTVTSLAALKVDMNDLDPKLQLIFKSSGVTI